MLLLLQLQGPGIDDDDDDDEQHQNRRSQGGRCYTATLVEELFASGLAHPFTQCVSRKDWPSNLVTATCLNKEQNQWAYTLVRHGILWVPLWYILVSDV